MELVMLGKPHESYIHTQAYSHACFECCDKFLTTFSSNSGCSFHPKCWCCWMGKWYCSTRRLSNWEVSVYMISVFVCIIFWMLPYLFAFFLGLYSSRIGGAHGRYGIGDWTYPQCREYLMSVCSRVVEVLYSIFLIEALPFSNWRNYICRKRTKGGHFLKSATTSGHSESLLPLSKNKCSTRLSKSQKFG